MEIEGSRIAAVYVGDHPRATDLGNSALIPGLVNAHTHLEFSDLEQPLGPATPFTSWIRSVMKSRFESSGSADLKIQRGLHESLSAGTTCLGEIATSSESFQLLEQSQPVPRAVVFRECLGFSADRISEQEQIAVDFLAQRMDQDQTAALHVGLSPHAPYSVHPDLYASLIQLAQKQDAPVAVHLGETQAEWELLEQKRGPFVELLTELGLWNSQIINEGLRMTDYLEPLTKLSSALAIHGNYFGKSEIELLKQSPQISVVYCPRTHHYFGHPVHPWLKMIGQGINVALGTDSRASNPDLSLWNELLFLRAEFSEVSPGLILECGTLSGARALGLAGEIGSLAVGKRADLALIQFAESAEYSSGSDLLLNSRSHVARVMLNGCWVN